MESELTIEQMKAAVLEKFSLAQCVPQGSGCIVVDVVEYGATVPLSEHKQFADHAWRDAWQKHCASPKASEGERGTPVTDKEVVDELRRLGWMNQGLVEMKYFRKQVRRALTAERELLQLRQQPTAQPDAERVTHGMNCSAWTNAQGHEVNSELCTCGYRHRVALQTEQTMHAAWRKRAEEAEAELLRLSQQSAPVAESASATGIRSKAKWIMQQASSELGRNRLVARMRIEELLRLEAVSSPTRSHLSAEDYEYLKDFHQELVTFGAKMAADKLYIFLSTVIIGKWE